MRSSITRATEAIRKQYNLDESLIIANEEERFVDINLPSVKKNIHIPMYTPTAKVKTIIREAMRGEEEFQEMMRNVRQGKIL